MYLRTSHIYLRVYLRTSQYSSDTRMHAHKHTNTRTHGVGLHAVRCLAVCCSYNLSDRHARTTHPP